MNWNDILKPYSPKVLSYMCGAFGVNEYIGKVTPTNRLRVVELLRKHLGKPNTVHSALDMMGPVEIFIIKTLLSHDGHADTETVRRTVEQGMLVKQHTPGAAPTPVYQGVPGFEDAVLRATSYGLVFTRDNHEIDIAPGKFMFIPDPVLSSINADAAWKKALDGAVSRDTSPSLAPAPDGVSVVSAADFQRDLSRYLRHVRKQKEVPLTAVGWIYKTNFKTFLAALNAPADAPNDEASNGRLWFMRRLLTKMGELYNNENAITPNPAAELLKVPMAQRIKRVFSAWSESGAWNEMNRIRTDHQGYDYRRDAPPELVKARAAVLRQITRLATPVGSPARSGPASAPADISERWIGTNQLIDQMRRSDYQFLFSRKHNYRDLAGSTNYFNSPYYSMNNAFNMSFPNVKDEKSGWEDVERQVIISMLTGPLYWMGLLSLGYAKSQTLGEGVEPSAFRLTQAGAWLLGLAKQPEFIETGGRVLVQPNFTIIAMEPISDAVLIAIDEFAESQGGDRAITYHLTRQSVYQAQRQGWTAKAISAFLEQHQGAPIPANVQRSLDEWQLQHQRITFHRSAPVVQYADVKALNGARQALQQAGRTTQSLAPLCDLIENGTADGAAPAGQLSAVLNAAGWLPLITPANDGAAHAQNSLRINEAGEVLFKESVPSLFALSQLQPFIEQDGDRSRISAPSIRAAMAKGIPLDQLLGVLKHLSGGPLLAKVETNIRAWAGFYGNATLRAVHLLELSSLEVLNNLLNDEQVGAYLRPIDAGVYPLAFVDAANVDLVRNTLIERGVTLK